jgi:hypothetical protein
MRRLRSWKNSRGNSGRRRIVDAGPPVTSAARGRPVSDTGLMRHGGHATGDRCFRLWVSAIVAFEADRRRQPKKGRADRGPHVLFLTLTRLSSLTDQ